MISHNFDIKYFHKIFDFVLIYGFNRFNKDLLRMKELSGIKENGFSYYYLYKFKDDIWDFYRYDIKLDKKNSFRYTKRNKSKMENEYKIIHGKLTDVNKVYSLRENEAYIYGSSTPRDVFSDEITLKFINQEILTHFLLEFK